MRLLLILAILPLTLWIAAPELPSPDSPGVTSSGVILGGEEELLYEVKWTFVRLGTIRLKAHPNLSAEAYIDSFDGLPYVDLHAIHCSQMDSSFPGEQTSVDLDAVDYPVRAVEIEGTTTVEGVFGMTGDFKGWFSDDAAAVPLKGRLKVLLGWVNVELSKWDRPGWTPPG